jgi:hypothetical protein
MLLNDELLPITGTIGFVEIDCRTAAAAYGAWRQSIKDNAWVTQIASRPIAGDLTAALLTLLPLKARGANRHLFLPTSGVWTAYFDNGWTGSDPIPVLRRLVDVLGCRAVRMTAVSPRPPTADAERRFGATVFELLDPVQGPLPLRVLRSVGVVQDGARWTFDALGASLPFEQTDRYLQKRIRDRFNADVLDRYLRALGIAAFDAQFYMPAGRDGLLLETSGEISSPRNADVSLAQAQRGR